MTHQFAGTWWQILQDLTDGPRIQKTCLAKAIEVIRGKESSSLQLLPEIPSLIGDCPANQILFDARNPGEHVIPQGDARVRGLFQRAAHGRDAEFTRKLDDNFGDAREDMDMLMPIEVRRPDAG